MAVEPLLNSPQMREQQLQELIKKTRWVYDNTAFWGGRIRQAGATPDQIRTWDDFHKRIPITTKEDFRKYAEDLDFDMIEVIRGWLGDSVNRLLMVATTSGTTGQPTPYPLPKEDLDLWHEFYARCFWRVGFYPGDRALQAFGLSMFLAGVPMMTAVVEYGACGIPVGAEAGTERILQHAKLFKPKALFCTPSLAVHLIEEASKVLGHTVDTLGIEILMCAGEPGVGIPEVRSKIQNAYGAKLYDFGCGFGCSCKHPEYQGMHWLCDDHAVLEIVDPTTFESIPMEDGATGLAVHTTLGRAMLTGYRQTIGDIVQVHTSTCPCGQTGLRFRVIGRNDDMLKVKGVMVYPAAIEAVVNSFVPRVTGEFRIVLDESPPRVVPPLKMKIEYGEATTETELSRLGEEIIHEMHSRVKIRPQINWVAPRTLERFLTKKKVFEKTYE